MSYHFDTPDNESNKFISDKDVSEMLSVSPAWIRKQRLLRKRSEDHVFNLDPVYIGALVRYRKAEVENWLADL